MQGAPVRFGGMTTLLHRHVFRRSLTFSACAATTLEFTATLASDVGGPAHRSELGGWGGNKFRRTSAKPAAGVLSQFRSPKALRSRRLARKSSTVLPGEPRHRLTRSAPRFPALAAASGSSRGGCVEVLGLVPGDPGAQQCTGATPAAAALTVAVPACDRGWRSGSE